MFRNLTSEQRTRVFVRQASPEWKAERETRMDAGIQAGTHVLCEICHTKDRKAEPAYDICTRCWVVSYYAEAKARVIVRVQAGGAS